jgi:hypothetical protein
VIHRVASQREQDRRGQHDATPATSPPAG